MATLIFRECDDPLAERCQRMLDTGPSLKLEGVTRAVHFLRGVGSRSGIALTAFYQYVGSRMPEQQPGAVPGYPGVLLRHSLEFSSLATISLAARKAFDHGADELTGNTFAKASDAHLAGLGAHWNKVGSHEAVSAERALRFLRSLFRQCSCSVTDALKSGTPLVMRLGLLKQHANRSAAHLSMENYELDIVDLVHVVAALVLIGEIVRSFDDPNSRASYFNEIDEGAHAAAKALFPALPEFRLFKHENIAELGRRLWRSEGDVGIQFLLHQLPNSLG